MLNELKKFGLSEKEAKVYLAALELGQASVQDIAKKSGVNRATTYLMIESLEKRGLMYKLVKNKKKLFAADTPERFLYLLQSQKNDMEMQKKAFEELLPELKSIYNLAPEKPRIRFFEGKEGLKEIQEDFLSSQTKEIEVVYSVDALNQVFSEREQKEYMERRVKKEVRVRALYTRSSGPFKEAPKMTEEKFLPEDKFPFSSDITIYGDKVAIASLRGKLVGVIMESKEIASTLRSLFELGWEGAQKYQN